METTLNGRHGETAVPLAEEVSSSAREVVLILSRVLVVKIAPLLGRIRIQLSAIVIHVQVRSSY